ncbi:hypothetical protein GCM10010971_18950 [Silvimonas amylolytica]|uniref:Uncharacterized protein n=1 Tax=Silvimonas amylolytica TaxID=449663 RepID=A0ABQ2PLI7_9NEIS|nr:hypothetical protein GCM10010971_18950 [Silvimonas amylolytica]
MRRYGAIRGVQITRARTRRCSAAYRALLQTRMCVPRGQAGFIDMDCPGCEIPDIPDGCCDAMDCGCDIADCGWEWAQKAREEDDDKMVQVKPKVDG